jgi:hypothetical protein
MEGIQMSTTYKQTAIASPDHPKGQIESLRHILELNQRRRVSYREAEEVGESLMTFFEVLAQDIGVPTL